MKILVACELPDRALSELRALGTDVAYEPKLTAGGLGQIIDDVSILIVDQLAVTPDVLVRAKHLQLIVRAGSGGGQVAVDEASSLGVFVSHTPSKDAIACAELALGLLLALDRQVVDNANTLRDGRWERERFLDARGLAGRTLGVIGPCGFCRAVAQRAAAFDMKIMAWTPEHETTDAPACDIQVCNWPRDVARGSDMIVVHGPVVCGGEPVITEYFLDSLQPGSYLVHVGEQSLLKEDVLAGAVERNRLRIALDVYPGDTASTSGRVRSKLLQIPGVIGTHHVGGATDQARQAIADEVVRIASDFLVSGIPVNTLNICERSPATWQLVLRVRDQVGVMAAVLDTIRADGINAQEITSRVFVGAKAAWLTIAMEERPSTEALSAIRGFTDVLHCELRAVV